jgi:hypothetical protein
MMDVIIKIVMWKYSIKKSHAMLLNSAEFWDLGFGIWDLEFGIWDLGFGVCQLPRVTCCWLLDAGYLLLVTCCWLLVAGYLLLVTCCWLLVAGCLLLVAGCLLLVACCWLLVAGYLLLVACCLLRVSLFTHVTCHASPVTYHFAFRTSPSINENNPLNSYHETAVQPDLPGA